MDNTQISTSKNFYRWLGLIIAVVGAVSLIGSGIKSGKVAFFLVGVSFLLSGISWFRSPLRLEDLISRKDQLSNQIQSGSDRLTKACAVSAAFLLVASALIVFFHDL